MATDHSVGFEPADELAKDRESVRKQFWRKLKKLAVKLPFAEDLLAAYYCAFDRQTPRHVQAALLGVEEGDVLLVAWAGSVHGGKFARDGSCVSTGERRPGRRRAAA